MPTGFGRTFVIVGALIAAGCGARHGQSPAAAGNAFASSQISGSAAAGSAQKNTGQSPAKPGGAKASDGAASASLTPAASPEPQVPLAEGTKAVPYVVKRGDSVPILASRNFSESIYMRRADYEEVIRRVNGLTANAVKPGATILIPGIPVAPILDKPVAIPKELEIRALYLTAYTAGSSKGLDLIEAWKKAGGNAVVFDIKDYDGELHVPFDHKYAPKPDITIRNLPKFVHYLHGLNMHAIARIALFRDAHLAQTYANLAVHSRRTGKPWLEGGKLAWVDPSNPEVQEYDLDLAKMAARAGADEIQFDYVRFPAEGDQADAEFHFEKEHPDWPRSKVITGFVAHAYDELHPMGVLMSIDVFGVMAWARTVDLNLTGQFIADLAHHADVISPMIYPSHFYKMDGYALPGDAPEHFISESMKRFETTTAGSGVILRPWLQAFGWRTKTYSPAYIVTQVRVAKDDGGLGFLFWNARNDYSKPFAAMPEMRAAGTRYFRGDEVGKPIPQVAAVAATGASAPPAAPAAAPVPTGPVAP